MEELVTAEVLGHPGWREIEAIILRGEAIASLGCLSDTDIR